MTIKLRHISNFLRIVKLHQDKNKSLEKEVKKTFSLEPVIENTYQNVKRINFDNMYYRTDIGKKGLIYLKGASNE